MYLHVVGAGVGAGVGLGTEKKKKKNQSIVSGEMVSYNI